MNSELRPDDLKAMRGLEAAGKVRLFELGPAVDEDVLWFNLGPDARKPAAARPWLNVALAPRRRPRGRSRGLRQHRLSRRRRPGSTARCRRATRLVLGRVPRYGHDVPRARQLLTEAGLKDVNGDGIFETSTGKPLTIELLTQRGNAIRERGAEVIASDLEEAGLTVDVVPLDVPALIHRLTKGTYDAAYYAISSSDTDPSANLDYWLSSGSFHIWHPGQTTPATPWEAEIDPLMQELTGLTSPAERQARFAGSQEIYRHRAADDLASRRRRS